MNNKTKTKVWNQNLKDKESSRSQAHRVRDEFKRRRHANAQKIFLSFSETEALHFMEFADLPSSTELKRKYLQLAKKLHPDCQGGNEELFKKLQKSYSYLSEKITRVD